MPGNLHSTVEIKLNPEVRKMFALLAKTLGETNRLLSGIEADPKRPAFIVGMSTATEALQHWNLADHTVHEVHVETPFGGMIELHLRLTRNGKQGDNP